MSTSQKGRISVKTIAITVLALIGGFFGGIVLSEIIGIMGGHDDGAREGPLPQRRRRVGDLGLLALGWPCPVGRRPLAAADRPLPAGTGRLAHTVCPLLVLACDQDRSALPGPAVRAAPAALRGELIRLPGGHYEPRRHVIDRSRTERAPGLAR
jgi:hypothetical protein